MVILALTCTYMCTIAGISRRISCRTLVLGLSGGPSWIVARPYQPLILEQCSSRGRTWVLVKTAADLAQWSRNGASVRWENDCRCTAGERGAGGVSEGSSTAFGKRVPVGLGLYPLFPLFARLRADLVLYLHIGSPPPHRVLLLSPDTGAFCCDSASTR